MITFIIWFAAFFCPNPNHTAANHGDCNLIHGTCSPSNGFDDDDTGGETGNGPRHPHPPPPPPPPPGN